MVWGSGGTQGETEDSPEVELRSSVGTLGSPGGPRSAGDILSVEVRLLA